VVALVKINSQLGPPGIKAIPPQIKPETRPPLLNLRHQEPRLAVAPGRAEVEIDYRKPQADLGFYRPLAFARQGAAAGKETALRAIARYAAEGDRLARIEDRSFSFGELGEAVWARSRKELNVAALSPPEVAVHLLNLQV